MVRSAEIARDIRMIINEVAAEVEAKMLLDNHEQGAGDQ